ncbi:MULTISPECIES: DUF2203 domain-containing protein [Caldilinea]|jgi:hypothetical protein|uniref:DUF2203 family protein n=1 Tax=Caldilinea aerophila (strain DSM 14535 / JCM 11387 / NBRC 104270 / STL-6-O1) TaxID=926550 RepID=I0I3R4_CALAS|nr:MULTISPECIES: DUF2203 domain-containing protein [Caldilinea]MBO9393821.1 DUF2203 domain-containing protein [Caldilinea sp.]BAL99901.1 hypothetical protein CLDAP_18620 [Caldilinea aerophila DSM 14535 = NBRC 104270]GIV73428.1 MAG: hypothetical protein KatS3mg049_1984 [Caldilinea sp.]
MKARYFTLEEAQATLPQVKKLMEQVQSARREILRLRPDALPAIEQAALNGGNKLLGELAVHVMRLEEGVRGIMALGAVIKDIDAGLVDFIGLRNGREIFLCWQYGEEAIGYWHELNAGFAGRRPLDEYIQ